MAFFTFWQNNSGGYFLEPAEYVIIEAPNAEAANARAIEAGLYFKGVEAGIDCECCGDRWSEQFDEGHEVPSIYTGLSAECSGRDFIVIYQTA